MSNSRVKSEVRLTFFYLCQWLLDRLENRSSVSLAPIGSSCRKSPANIIENPPKSRLRFLISFSFLSSVNRIVSLMNGTSSITTIRTSCHTFLSSMLSCFHWLRKVALEIVTPPMHQSEMLLNLCMP